MRVNSIFDLSFDVPPESYSLSSYVGYTKVAGTKSQGRFVSFSAWVAYRSSHARQSLSITKQRGRGSLTHERRALFTALP